MPLFFFQKFPIDFYNNLILNGRSNLELTVFVFLEFIFVSELIWTFLPGFLWTNHFVLFLIVMRNTYSLLTL